MHIHVCLFCVVARFTCICVNMFEICKNAELAESPSFSKSSCGLNGRGSPATVIRPLLPCEGGGLIWSELFNTGSS